MNTKINIFIIPSAVFILCIILSGCYSDCSNKQPEETIKNYYGELANDNIDKALSYVKAEDSKLFKKSEEYNNPIIRDVLVIIHKNATYEVVNAKVDIDRADVEIKLKKPDFGGAIGTNIAEGIAEVMIKNDVQDFSLDNVWQGTLNNLKKGNFEYIEEVENISLVCENNAWKIVLDLKKKKRIKKLLMDGVKAESKKNYSKAISCYNQILKIDKNNELAHICLKRLENKMKDENSPEP